MLFEIIPKTLILPLLHDWSAHIAVIALTIIYGFTRAGKHYLFIPLLILLSSLISAALSTKPTPSGMDWDTFWGVGKSLVFWCALILAVEMFLRMLGGHMRRRKYPKDYRATK